MKGDVKSIRTRTAQQENFSEITASAVRRKKHPQQTGNNFQNSCRENRVLGFFIIEGLVCPKFDSVPLGPMPGLQEAPHDSPPLAVGMSKLACVLAPPALASRQLPHGNFRAQACPTLRGRAGSPPRSLDQFVEFGFRPGLRTDVVFTAAVSIGGEPATSGNVLFDFGNGTSASVAVADGQAVYDPGVLNAGSYTLNATFDGDDSSDSLSPFHLRR